MTSIHAVAGTSDRSFFRRTALIVFGQIFAVAAAVWLPSTASIANEDVWPDLKSNIFGERNIGDGTAHLSVDAPYRADDAALVPITITTNTSRDVARTIKTVTLVIDENPAPVAAVFHLAPGSNITRISTRVRINAYSHVRAVAEMNDGELYMVSRFVKASGGCSAPASKNHDQAVAEMGKMRLRQYGRSAATGKNSDRAREVQLQIRHPNHSGLQMDQLTGYYIPAHFVEKIEIYQGAARLLAIEGAISLSEDPSVRFIFTPVGRENLEARVVDNEEKVFKGSWPFREAGDKNM